MDTHEFIDVYKDILTPPAPRFWGVSNNEDSEPRRVPRLRE